VRHGQSCERLYHSGYRPAKNHATIASQS
jgi:hypothetical protein